MEEEIIDLELEKEINLEDIKDMGNVSDGYHTFNELYYYRMLYNAAFLNELGWYEDNSTFYNIYKSRRHHDGEYCFDGKYFIVSFNTPDGPVTNHYEIKYWDYFNIPEKDIADEWDGHMPQIAAERLKNFILTEQLDTNNYGTDEEI